MKYFLKTLALFSIPIIAICLLDSVILSPAFFANRAWEGLLISEFCKQPFCANQNIHKHEVGDLGHHTKYAIQKDVCWITDDLGYRNDSVINNPDVVILGDSFVAGCSLDQDELLSNVLYKKAKKRLTFYNVAPVGIGDFVTLVNQGVIKKPKYLISLKVERYFPPGCDTMESKELALQLQIPGICRSFQTTIYRLRKFTSKEWFSARLRGSVGGGIVSPINNQMLFFQGNQSINSDTSLLTNSIHDVEACMKKCNNMGVKFLFVPMPNKESVYWEDVPYASQPDFLFRLDSALNAHHINCINTLSLYNSAKSNGRLLYHLDDTHWTPNAVNMVADQILLFIDSTTQK